jgi:anti-sigma factor ChrR (cupin superfamily)
MAMEIRADFSQREVVLPGQQPWTPSPLAGVERQMLDRSIIDDDGSEEIARATSIVRYAKGSHFTAHAHERGEEFLVLEGTFADEHGVYPVGTYVRNPPGSSHTPYSEEGCTLLVKLRQFDPEDNARVVIDTARASWRAGLVPGLSVLPLHAYGTEGVALVRWAPDTVFQPHTHPGGEEIWVLDGVFEDEHGSYPKGSWLRNPSMSRHQPFTRNGATIWVKTGHLQGLPERG